MLLYVRSCLLIDHYVYSNSVRKSNVAVEEKKKKAAAPKQMYARGLLLITIMRI